MTDFLPTTILVLANACGDLFVVDYLYGGEFRYRIQIINSDPTSVVDLYQIENERQNEYEYLNEIGDNLRCIVEGFYEDGFTIVVRDAGDLTSYYLMQEEDDE